MPRSRPRALPRPRPALSASVVDKPPWCISCARAHNLCLGVACGCFPSCSLFCFVTSAHPHQSITNGTHYRVAQRVLASQSLVDALQLLPHRARPTTSTLHPAPLCALCTRSPVPWPLLLSSHSLFSRPSHQLLPCSHHPSSIHQSTIPSACLARPCFFVSTGPLQQVDFDLALDWTELNLTGLVWSDISTSAGCPAVARDFPLDTHTHRTHPHPFSASPPSRYSSIDFWIACCLLPTNHCVTPVRMLLSKHSHRIPTQPK